VHGHEKAVHPIKARPKQRTRKNSKGTGHIGNRKQRGKAAMKKTSLRNAGGRRHIAAVPLSYHSPEKERGAKGPRDPLEEDWMVVKESKNTAGSS